MKLTFEVDVDINLDELGTKDVPAPTPEEVGRILNYCLDEYSDGRRSFDVEMLEHAAIRVVRRAIEGTIKDKHAKKYNRQHIEYETNGCKGSTAKFVITSEPICKRIQFWFRNAFRGFLRE